MARCTESVMRIALMAAALVVTTACSSSSNISSASPSAATPAQAVAGGCGSTTIYRGPVPAWVDDAGAHNNPDGLPYVIASPADVAGFVFGYPLRAGHPENPSNKILWVVRLPRNGSDLIIAAHPLDAASPTVSVVQPANSSPGEIYPSIVDVPMPGCWHLDLRWAGHEAGVDLTFAT